MTPYTENMYQTATYWAPALTDGFGGRELSAPVLIKCRWQDKNDLVRNGAGQQVASSATIYTDRLTSPEGFLALGDYSAVMDPTPTLFASKIISTGSSPSLDATEVLYKAWV